MSELLPCPFCGGTTFEVRAEHGAHHYLWCGTDGCNARMWGCNLPTLRSQWNTRAPAPVAPERGGLPPALCQHCQKPLPMNGPYYMPCHCQQVAAPVVPGGVITEEMAMRAYNEGFHAGSHWAMKGGKPQGWKESKTKADLSAALSPDAKVGGGEAWISAKEPPKFRDSVWCATRREGTPTVIEGRHDHHGWWLIHDGCAYSFPEYDYEEPTHWQEIAVPKPPAQADGGVGTKP